MLNNFNMVEFKAAPFPFLLGINLEDGDSTPLVGATLYRKFIGIIMYLTRSQTEISYTGNVVPSYMHNPHEVQWKESNRLL